MSWGDVDFEASFETEKRAILLERREIIRIVSALRQYRAATRKLLAERYGDGEVDAAALGTFESEVAEAEGVLEGYGGPG